MSTKKLKTLNSKTTEVMFKDACSFQQLNEFEKALKLYLQIIDTEPKHFDALFLAGITCCEIGKFVQGIHLLQSAVNLKPKNVDVLYNLGHAFQKAKHYKEAEEIFRKTIILDPNIEEAFQNLAKVLDQQGNSSEADQILRNKMLSNPEMNKGKDFVRLINRHVTLGHMEEALKTCDLFYDAFLNNMFALSLKAFVLNEMGEAQSCKKLLDFKTFIKTVHHTCAPKYEKIKSLNDELIQYVISHPTLSFEPKLRTTRKGSQTAGIENETEIPIVSLRKLIEATISDYILTLSKNSDHPFLANIPKKLSLNIWATVLSGAGHQLPHFHPMGWLSGVYYAELPNIMETNNGSKAGWLEFGRPSDDFGFRANPVLHSIQPKQGLMVLFPSYFFHRTIPFNKHDRINENQKRISFAFDAIPEIENNCK